METTLKIGDQVSCKKFGSLKHDFVGTVEKIYDNSAMVSIDKYDESDNITVTDFHNRAIVRLSSMKKVSA
ncbi:hypothetical protein FC65_GL000993 [Ligilactobacillus acidipiscis DSM 15836]|jgi:uncharacterized protein YkvS|uniref:DUF2187 domain-containing protein n=2 Tax=Ligilactobacillus acidipiscis TaxID=89059 RepID=A0A0R2JX99_9LACO|nr:hypothetical protein [Ligilactobacillus acidipiscis]KRM20917.1 hypothetical protein FC65_GL000993 [Ligilactobacillus acidipiscis DSM 15836]KRN81731.1 hypothetical protein IV43_GL001796 [Ligilactobacillus acidipiscis]MCI1925091.1 DUF2187 domain-containing protein [Ligilactobacillus acidipiscis]WEV57915.1 DUF2187 domain-containing protein [Ligilactobacillus acidipiscis]SFV40370.1 hypothetical protein LAC1533_0950 [Ligilactobacillus acidipiscis]